MEERYMFLLLSKQRFAHLRVAHEEIR
jgi:hypothetical protein